MRFYFLIISFVITIFESEEIHSQILFNNPSFEENGPCTWCSPIGWYICYQTPDIYTGPISNTIPEPSEGNLFVYLVTPPTNSAGSEKIGTKVCCVLDSDADYFFYADLRSLTQIAILQTKGILNIWGGTDSCEMSYLLWRSKSIDSLSWVHTKISFTCPEDISTLVFAPQELDTFVSGIFIDNLSPIYCSNLNKVHFVNTSNDTIIYSGECVNLYASANAFYDSMYWHCTQPGFSASTLDGGLVCPEYNATYIVAIHDTGCGHFWSYDTLRVTVLEPPLPSLQIPNFLSEENPVWKIINPKSSMQVSVYNTLGQLVYRRSDYQNTLNINTLAAATYFYEVKVGSDTYRGKLIVVR